MGLAARGIWASGMYKQEMTSETEPVSSSSEVDLTVIVAFGLSRGHERVKSEVAKLDLEVCLTCWSLAMVEHQHTCH